MLSMADHIEVELSDSLAPDRLPGVMGLFADQWWTKDRSAEDVAAMLEHCDLVATVTDTQSGALLGFARVITDFTYVALLLDVIVAETSRGKGLGALLMDAVVNDPRLESVQSLELTCQQDLEEFYARWGFTSRVGGSRLMRRTTSAFFLSD
jgi:GNAT superfamily N-acetyltransferase